MIPHQNTTYVRLLAESKLREDLIRKAKTAYELWDCEKEYYCGETNDISHSKVSAASRDLPDALQKYFTAYIKLYEARFSSPLPHSQAKQQAKSFFKTYRDVISPQMTFDAYFEHCISTLIRTQNTQFSSHDYPDSSDDETSEPLSTRKFFMKKKDFSVVKSSMFASGKPAKEESLHEDHVIPPPPPEESHSDSTITGSPQSTDLLFFRLSEPELKTEQQKPSSGKHVRFAEPLLK